MTVKQYLHNMLTEAQTAVLLSALRARAPVHFYGTGLGKSQLACRLRALGYEATAAGDPVGGAPDSVLDADGVIALCMKKETGMLGEELPGQEEFESFIREAVSAHTR